MKDTHTISRVWAWILAGILLLSALPVLADTPADFVDLSKACSVTVSASNSQDKDFTDDLAQVDIQVDLYLVAAAQPVSGYDTYTYKPAEPFKDLEIPGRPTADDWKAIAKDAAEIIYAGIGTDKALEPAATGKAGEKIDGDDHKGLAAGLYAIVAHGADLTSYVKEVPGEGEDAAPVKVTIANTPVYEYQFTAELISLPTKTAADGQPANTADTTPWIYDAEAAMKPGRVQRLGDLEITKQLDTYRTGEPATFVFELTVTNVDGTVFPTKVYMLNFSSTGTKSVLVKDLPAGAKVHVDEKYSGAAYELVASEPDNVIAAEQIVGVSFENDYHDTPDGGYGILNHFTYDEEKGWVWTPAGENVDSASVQEVTE